MAARAYNRNIQPRERWLRISEVVEFSGKSRSTIYRYIESGMLRPKYQKRPTGTMAMRFAESEVRKLFEPMTSMEALRHIS